MANRTPLYDRHVELGGKIVEFGGYELPVQYSAGLSAEHMAVRQKAGLFDVSHMGEFIVEGPGAAEFLDYVMSNVFSNLAVGRVRYGLMLNDDGGIIDDLVVYRLGEEKFMPVVNAANREKDFNWLKTHLPAEGVTLEDVSDGIALFALQGPASKDILTKLVAEEDLPTKFYSFVEGVPLAGAIALISRTGYTGEFGYEIYIPAVNATAVWDALLEAGEEFGLLPAGLGARDTLRLEAAMPLYGHEMNEQINPLEAGLNFAVKLEKPGFLGQDALKGAELGRKRIGLEVTGRGIVREDADLYVGDNKVGFTTSGTKAPYLGKAIAMGYVTPEYAELGTELEADVRGRRIAVKVVELPFYKAQ